jgi:hypothetical protein
MSWLSDILGYGDDAETYAANVTAQWRSLALSFTVPPSDAWERAHASFVNNYGPMAGTEEEQYNRALANYKNGIDHAATDAFMDEIKRVPDIIVDVAGKGVAAVSGALPFYVKAAIVAGLALFVYKTLK